MKNEVKHTAHSSYRCEYHIVFASKYRRREIYGQLKADIGEIFRKLCKEKNVEIIEAEACANHIHMLVSIPPYLSISQFVGFLKGKSSLMQGLRMNRAHDIGEEVIIVGATTAFACKADFGREVFQDIECDMAHYGHIFS